MSFTLGIAAQKAGMNAFQSGFMSAAMLASAGQFAGIQALVSGAGYVEMIVTEIVVNLRYLLMSGALSQKVRRDRPFFHRLIMAYGVTDEIFAVSMGPSWRESWTPVICMGLLWWRRRDGWLAL